MILSSDAISRLDKWREALKKNTITTTQGMSSIDKSRQITREKFTLSMLLAIEEWNMSSSKEKQIHENVFVIANKVAIGLEAAMYIHFSGVNQLYKEKFRMLCFNLNDSKNPELRSSILHGNITGKQLLTSSSNDLASLQLKSERKLRLEKHLSEQVEVKLDGFILLKTHKGEEYIKTNKFEEDINNSNDKKISYKSVEEID